MSGTSSSKFAKLHPLPMGEARWTSGFWAARFKQCCDVMVPTMHKLMTETERPRYLGNFEVALGLVEGRHRGPKWNDGDFYKWLEAAAATYAFTKDAKLDQQMDEAITLITKTQENDGYIHTDVQIAQRAGNSEGKRFGNPMDFEMYNMGHLITASIVHKRATGKTTLLGRGLAAADFLAKTFAHPTPDIARHGICPAHLMALVELHRETREQKYLDLAIKLLNMRDLVESGDDDNQDRVPLRKESRAAGHAVRGTYLWAGAADIYSETGDPTLLDPLHRIWDDLVRHKLYITGGCGALYDGASPDGATDQKTITRVHQSFGRDWQLPHTTAHNETCAAIGNLLWNWRMFQITGDVKFADVVEWTLYNSVLAGINLAGDAFFYTNTLRQLYPEPVETRWPKQRQKTLGCFCCPPNVVRTIAQASTYAYAANNRGVTIVLYGGSTLDTRDIKLTQETNYPWDGRVKITIDRAPSSDYSLSLRIPGWAKCASIRLNGKATPDSPLPATFHEIRRAWKSGDIVELELPMPVRIVEAHPYVEETRNQVAILRGPIVYCLESTDLPEGLRVLDVHVPRDAQLTTRHDNNLLGGVTVIEGKAIAQPAGEWKDQLYRDFASTAASAKPIDLRLIPYYAWDNRGKSEMTVWLA